MPRSESGSSGQEELCPPCGDQGLPHPGAGATQGYQPLPLPPLSPLLCPCTSQPCLCLGLGPAPWPLEDTLLPAPQQGSSWLLLPGSSSSAKATMWIPSRSSSWGEKSRMVGGSALHPLWAGVRVAPTGPVRGKVEVGGRKCSRTCSLPTCRHEPPGHPHARSSTRDENMHMDPHSPCRNTCVHSPRRSIHTP